MDEQAWIEAERHRLAGRLRTLSDADWRTASLCPGWTVHHVLAHLVTPFLVSTPALAWTALRHRGFAAAMDVQAKRIAQRPPAELIDILATNASSTFRPPGGPAAAPLTDIVIHSADIRWAMGDPHEDWAQQERLRPVLDFLVGPKARAGFVPRGRLHGLHLLASDLGWESGTGDDVTGRALPLAMGILGRTEALRQLTGRGIGALAP